MQKRKFDELISHFNRKVSEMSIEQKYKMELLGMISAIGFAHEKELSTNLAEVGTDCISRQAAIDAICNACGKIDCDKMDKCEKLQLPPANCSEFPNNSDTISRQAAIDALTEDEYREFWDCIDSSVAADIIRRLPPAEPKRGRWINGHCSECNEHAPYWCMASTYHASNFCPMCGAKMEVTT